VQDAGQLPQHADSGLAFRVRKRAVQLSMAGGFLSSGLGLLLVPELRGFLRLEHGQVQGWYGRRYPRVFTDP